MISSRAEKLVRKLRGGKALDFNVETSGRSPMKTRFDAATRSEAIFLDHAGAAIDPDFNRLTTQGDAARDASSWDKAEDHYSRALELYPFHSGYRIQYSHVIKEQGKFDWAEVHYRSALAEGANADMVVEHLQFVARHNRANYIPRTKFDLNVAPFDAPPSFHDIQTLAWLFWHDAELNASDALMLLRQCETNREVVLAMTVHDRFVECNRPFLEILRG